MGPRVRLLVAASCAVAVSAWTARARAEDEAAFFTLVVNQVDQGDPVFVVLRDGDVLIERKELESAGLRGFTATEVKAQGRVLISLASVQPSLKFDADDEAIVLKIDAPIEMLPSHSVDLSTQPQDVSYHSRASAFLNYSPSVVVPTNAPASGSAFLEGGISETNRLWYSGITGATENGIARQLTNLTVDNRAAMVHTIVGDANVATGAIGAASVLVGLTYARDFTLNPYFIRFPSMRFTSATDVPATVDVYVNGIRTKTIALDPGTSTLDNLKGLVGGGTVQYVLRDALGGVRTFSTPYYVAASVLKPGLSDFALSAGLPRDNVGAATSDARTDVLGEYELPAVVGYYRRGMTDWLTLGVRGEAQWGTVVSGGPDIATTTPLGVFELELGASAGGPQIAQSGGAGTFAYQYLSRRLSVSTSFRALTPGYSYVQLSPVQDRALYQVSSSVSVPFGDKTALTSTLAVAVDRDQGTIATAGMFASVSLTRSLSLTAQVSFGTVAPPTPEIDGLLRLSWSLPDATFVGAGASVQAGVPGVNLQVSRSSGYGEGWGMSAAANITQTATDVSVSHRLQTATNVLQTLLDWQGTSGTLSVTPAGSLVWVTGHGFFLARPLTDAFALVRVPEVKDVRVSLNAQDVGRTNARGDLLVPNMISYYASTLKVASQDVPLTFALDQDTIVVAPPRRGAALAEFRATRIHYFRGRVLVVRDGKEYAPSYGDLAVKDRGRDNVSPLGEDGAFELEGLTAGPHEAEIRHAKGTCKFRLDAKELSDAALIDLGVVRCTVGVSAPAAP